MHSQQNLQRKSIHFYHAEQLDNDEQITNVFWVDAKMILTMINLRQAALAHNHTIYEMFADQFDESLKR